MKKINNYCKKVVNQEVFFSSTEDTNNIEGSD